MNAPVLEFDPRTRNQIANRPRDKYLARPSLSGHPRTGVDRDTSKLAADEFALPGMQSSSDLQAERMQTIADCARAADRSSRSVESRQEPVARRVNLLSPPASKLPAHESMVCLEQVTPAAITEVCRTLGGANDIGHQDSGQHAVRGWAVPHPSQKLLNLVEDLVGINPREMVFPGELDKARVRNAIGDVLALSWSRVPVARAVQNQGRQSDARKDAAHIDAAVQED